jgi:predicted MFS family arabinose efflux permease
MKLPPGANKIQTAGFRVLSPSAHKETGGATDLLDLAGHSGLLCAMQTTQAEAVTKECVPSRWTVLIVIYLCTVSYSLILQSIPPVLSLIIHELHLSYHQAAVLMSLFALPGMIVALPAGFLADRYGIKRVGIVSFLLIVAGTIMVAVGETFVSLTVGRITAGIGAAGLVIVAPQGIAQWFRGKGIGSAMGIYNTALPVGFITSLNAFPLLASRWGWRSGMWVAATFAAVAFAIFLFAFQERKPEAHAVHTTIGAGNERSRIVLISLCWAFCQAGILSLFTFAPDFMVGKGISLKTAGFYTSLVTLGPLLLSPVVGYYVDRIRYPERLIVAGSVGMALLLLSVPFGGSHIVPFMLGIGICAALLPASVYSLTAGTVNQRHLGFAFGVLAMANNAGVFVGPQLVGIGLDAVGSYTTGFALMAILLGLSAAMAVAFALTRGRRGT